MNARGRMFPRTMLAAMMLACTNIPLLAQDPVLPAGQQQRAATAWDQSLAFEAGNDVRRAREVLVQAYGPRPDIYSVCVRLAWLSLRLREGDQAVGLYRHARELPGALPEATQGLRSALTMAGYDALDRGDLRGARRAWTEALTIDANDADARRGLDLLGPASGVAPELWIGALSATADTAMVRVLYVAVPYRITDALSVRGAYRRVAVETTFDSKAIFGSQSEYFGGVAYERGITATELVGLALVNSEQTSWGAAIATRVGGRYGLTLMASGLHRTDGWNAQVAPQGFLWLRPYLALSAGVRVTHDSAMSPSSPLAGATIRWNRLVVDAQAHFGAERFAVGMAGPTVMSFNASTARGATVTGAITLGRNKDRVLFVQAQFESLRTPDGTTGNGSYTGWALGLRMLPPRSKTETTR